jgi:hypothetical protein
MDPLIYFALMNGMFGGGLKRRGGAAKPKAKAKVCATSFSGVQSLPQ